MRNTLDLASVALAKQRTHLPVIVDPSHATGPPGAQSSPWRWRGGGGGGRTAHRGACAARAGPVRWAAGAHTRGLPAVDVGRLPAVLAAMDRYLWMPEVPAQSRPGIPAHVVGARMSTEVRQMFSSIATRYDVTNEVMSFGIHRLWRAQDGAAEWREGGDAVLDCASGTGDLALAFKRKVGDSGRVVGTDFCRGDAGPRSQQGRASGAPGGVPGGRCHGAALRGPPLRRGLHRLRHPQRG